MAHYINIHLIDRAYGGPEEGGWWYDVGEAVRSIPVPLAQRDKVFRRVHRICERENQGRPSLSSVSCRGIYRASRSDKPARDFPTESVHYE